MDSNERYKIQKSIEDVIGILDSAPIQPDLIPDTNIVQLTNRIPIAHLAIERGLKSLISVAGGTAEQTHSLNRLHSVLRSCDGDCADFLSGAFDDAVEFFGYNVNAKGFTQFRSLEIYLSRVGTDKAFEALRYWAIGESGKGDSPVPYISPPVHRELLCALSWLFLSDKRQTVSERVEREVRHAMFERRSLSWGPDDTLKKCSVYGYLNWLLNENSDCRSAMKEAVDRGFAVRGDDEFVSKILFDAFNDLQRSKDPAVLHFLRTLMYLPRGSQRRNPDAVPEMDWFSQAQNSGGVVTVAGTRLGYVERYADRAWGITPNEEGFVRVTDVVRSLADAKHYLVNRLTKLVDVSVNGQSKRLRLVNNYRYFRRDRDEEWTGSMESLKKTYDVEFWDDSHGLLAGDEVTIELPLEDSPSDRGIHVLKGTVKDVSEQRVSVTGSDFYDIKPEG